MMSDTIQDRLRERIAAETPTGFPESTAVMKIAIGHIDKLEVSLKARNITIDIFEAAARNDALEEAAKRIENVVGETAVNLAEDIRALKEDAQTEPLTDAEASLKAMIDDVRYWRDRDPEMIERVCQGLRDLHPKQSPETEVEEATRKV